MKYNSLPMKGRNLSENLRAMIKEPHTKVDVEGKIIERLVNKELSYKECEKCTIKL